MICSYRTDRALPYARAELGDAGFTDFIKRSEKPGAVEFQQTYGEVLDTLRSPGYFAFAAKQPILFAASDPK